jgi:hypothetical protein
MLANLLKILIKTAPGITNVTLFNTKSGVQLYAATEFSQVQLKTDLALDLNDPVSIPFSALDAALSKKKNPRLSVESDGTIVIKEGNTKTTIQLGDSPKEPTIEFPEGLVKVSINSDMWQFLTEKLPLLKIEKVHEALPDFRLYAMFSDKSTTLAVVDGVHQMSFIRSASVFEGVRGNFNLPYDKFLAALKAPTTSSMTMHLGEDLIGIQTPSMKSLINTPVAEGMDGDVYTAIRDKIKQLASFEGALISIPKAILSDFCATARAIALDDSRVIFSALDGKLKIAVMTASGTSELRLKTDSPDVTFALELKHIRTVIGKTPTDSVELRIGDGEIVLKGAVGYVGSLSEVS